MGTLDDSSLIFSFHRNMAAMHGDDSPFALGWRDDDDQIRRFEVLSGIADLNWKSILDAGCGYADLFRFLQKKSPMISAYYGVDFIPEMTERASDRLAGDNRARFFSGNFMSLNLPLADYVFASGSLNYMSSDPAYIYKAIEKLFSLCTHGLGFNLLRWSKKDGFLVSYNPEDIVAYCKTLSNIVVLKMDYDDEDFTVFMYRF